MSKFIIFGCEMLIFENSNGFLSAGFHRPDGSWNSKIDCVDAWKSWGYPTKEALLESARAQKWQHR